MLRLLDYDRNNRTGEVASTGHCTPHGKRSALIFYQALFAVFGAVLSRHVVIRLAAAANDLVAVPIGGRGRADVSEGRGVSGCHAQLP